MKYHLRSSRLPASRAGWRRAVLPCAICFALVTSRAVGSSPDLDFLVGLTDRGLYRLAAVHGAAAWKRGEGNSREQAELALQLSRVFARQAAALARPDRPQAWEKAHAVLDEYLLRHTVAPEHVLIHIQRAWIEIRCGDLERAETAGTPLEQAGLSAAREHVRKGIQQLKTAEQGVQEQLRLPSRPGEGLSEAELVNLRQNLDLELGRAFSVQGRCYPPDTADRDNAFLLALEHLERLVHRTDEGPAIWHARLEALRAHRELGRYEEAQALWEKWNEEPSPPDLRTALTAELVRLNLARGDISKALETSTIDRDEPAMQLVHLEALIARWHEVQRQEPAQGDSWARRITSQLDRIRQRADPEEVRRAERLAGGALAESSSDQPADALKLAAEALYFGGNWSAAVAAYDRAAAQLREESKQAEAFELGLVAAAIEHEAGRFDAASRRFRELVNNHPQDDRAPQAHLRAIVSAAESLRIALAEKKQGLLATYRALLSEHLQRWPSAETADEVRWWSARLAMSDRHWADAIQLLEAIPTGSDGHGRAVLALAECYEALLKQPAPQEAADAARRREWVARARRVLQPEITGADNQWPEVWSERQLEIALRLVRLSLLPGIEDVQYAESLLRAAWSGVANGNKELRRPVQDLLVRVLLKQDKHRAAASFLVGDGSANLLADIARLAQESPQNGDLQELHAALLAEGETPEQWTESLNGWEEVERHSQRGGARWFRARRARINLLHRLNRSAEAEKLERLTQLLYPR